MKKPLLIFLFGIFSIITASSQQTIIKGSVKDAVSFKPISDVSVAIEKSTISTKTNALGEFIFSKNVPLGEQILLISKDGFSVKRYPIVVNEGQTVDISDMTLDVLVNSGTELFTITLSDDELNDDTVASDNISGLLAASLDIYQRTAAFEFSSSFFRLRGLDSENGSILLNGIAMNKAFDGRPQWNNWGGLNDVIRNQELAIGLQPSSYNFGGFLGTTNINLRASGFRNRGSISYASSNRSYTNRVMASYTTGEMKNGWSVAMMLSRRWGNEGYQDATLYEANSFFASVEKKFNEKHSLNFTTIYTPNRRGKSSANTQEVFDLKGIKYNEYWGWQDGKKRNSRIKKVEEPILMLNHYWDISSKTKLNTNLAYQFGKIGDSRLDYNGQRLNSDGIPVGGGANPSPAYYQKLPSYWVTPAAGPNFEQAYLNEQQFLNDGQIDWNSLYQTNLENVDKYSTYILYEDRRDDTQFTANSILTSYLNDHVTINGAVNYSKLKSDNFAEIIDLLGGNGYLNVDSFDGFQFDERNPNAVMGEGDKFRYNYNLFSNVVSGFLQGQFKYNKVDFYVSASATNTQYQRDGLFQNGAYSDNSFGKGEKLTFTGIGTKAGFTYKLTGKHLFNVNAGYLTKAPTLRNTYPNARENHNIVPNITEEKLSTIDASYIYRSPIVKAKLTGYYSKTENATETAFYFSQGATVEAFVTEVLSGVSKKNIGAEFGVEAQVTPTILLKGVASLGQYTYDNNPDLNVYSTGYVNLENNIPNITGINSLGNAFMKDYKIASGPQKAYSVGFEYRDPDYWWFGATANFFDDTYLDISPILRTQSFALDSDGIPFNDYDERLAKELLKQEKFDSYMSVNLIGGKSWRIDDYYIGFFASINNILDKAYKTGGYEQARYSDFRTLRDDVSNEKRLFGPRYGRGTTYFMNVYLRF